MTVEKLEAWRATRQKGRLRYVLVNGLLAYGVPMFVVMTFFAHRADLSKSFIAISAVAWSIGGLLSGACTWWLHERNYQKHTGGA
ncbi:hypothetical protein [Lysobacter claricitrinus]|uniref:hypothetical protein n=1 Tax=Lysobacter claricitrinus TaxID=3367728 RepID=UPI0037DBC129